ncbi:hypothetical protein [Paenacidovorax monticola]|uniref:Uncharacterized protein n=1 Tax=Paenacidovorax monticola TaxID=1926868 RepID=A0A7H0HFY4_9BURK|nr:hypothetical protein [Paenacidovorax monticola]QNP59450.1 hypothetical protein H9L24_22140 [Paenacidovorax monticola]
MPITFSFDVETNSVKDPNDRTRVQMAFLRLGWEHVGGSSWRYPAIDADHHSEDWFNHVVPALMYFRSMAEHAGWVVTRYSLDAHSAAVFRGGAPALGAPIKSSAALEMYAPGQKDGQADKLSEARLRKFIEDSATALD